MHSIEDNIGKCRGDYFYNNGCSFKWDNSDPVDNEKYMTIYTHEEWLRLVDNLTSKL